MDHVTYTCTILRDQHVQDNIRTFMMTLGWPKVTLFFQQEPIRSHKVPATVQDLQGSFQHVKNLQENTRFIQDCQGTQGMTQIITGQGLSMDFLGSGSGKVCNNPLFRWKWWVTLITFLHQQFSTTRSTLCNSDISQQVTCLCGVPEKISSHLNFFVFF